MRPLPSLGAMPRAQSCAHLRGQSHMLGQSALPASASVNAPLGRRLSSGAISTMLLRRGSSEVLQSSPEEPTPAGEMPAVSASFRLSEEGAVDCVNEPLFEFSTSEAAVSVAWMPQYPKGLLVGTGYRWLRSYDLRQPGWSSAIVAHNKAVYGYACYALVYDD
jgi:hypothetical protein